jgi:TetR/AcrR family transcriptional repressor of nem operon
MNDISPTADKILACGRALIVSGGYNGFSYADIAEAVGIRKPSIHHHFPSKACLVETIVSRHLQEAQTGFAHLERAVPEPLDQLRAYIAHWKRCIGDETAPFCLCALLASEMPILPEEVALQVRAFFRFLSGWLTSVFERGVAEGTIVLRNAPPVEAEVFMAAVYGAMLSARAYGDTATFGTIMDAQLQHLSASR